MYITCKGYAHIHEAVQRIYGRASEYHCVDCDKPAYDWSHIHETDERESENYLPRCRSCHKKYDRSRQRISDEDIIEIRRWRYELVKTTAEISEAFGISYNYVNKILRGDARMYHTPLVTSDG
jgi:hypothetical protein